MLHYLLLLCFPVCTRMLHFLLLLSPFQHISSNIQCMLAAIWDSIGLACGIPNPAKLNISCSWANGHIVPPYKKKGTSTQSIDFTVRGSTHHVDCSRPSSVKFRRAVWLLLHSPPSCIVLCNDFHLSLTAVSSVIKAAGWVLCGLVWTRDVTGILVARCTWTLHLKWRYLGLLQSYFAGPGGRDV
jgi:hypothetical protein